MTNNHCVHKPELNSFGVKRCLFQAANQPNFSPQLLYWRLHLYSLFIVLKCKCTSWCSNPKQPAVLDTWDVDQQRAFCGWQVPVALLLGYMGCRWLGHHPHPHRLHPPLRRLDSVLSTTFSQLEREIRFGCSGEIQLFTGTNPVTELVATKAREESDTLWSSGSGRRLDCDCDSLLVTICSMITLCSASDSHHPVSTISFGIKGTYTTSPLKRDW